LHRYDVSKEGVHDVKWDQLICQKPQLHASKICILYCSGTAVFVFCHVNLRTTGICKAAGGIDVLPRDDANSLCV
jgi:hypothetical protein